MSSSRGAAPSWSSAPTTGQIEPVRSSAHGPNRRSPPAARGNVRSAPMPASQRPPGSGGGDDAIRGSAPGVVRPSPYPSRIQDDHCTVAALHRGGGSGGSTSGSTASRSAPAEPAEIRQTTTTAARSSMRLATHDRPPRPMSIAAAPAPRLLPRERAREVLLAALVVELAGERIAVDGDVHEPGLGRVLVERLVATIDDVGRRRAGAADDHLGAAQGGRLVDPLSAVIVAREVDLAEPAHVIVEELLHRGAVLDR